MILTLIQYFATKVNWP